MARRPDTAPRSLVCRKSGKLLSLRVSSEGFPSGQREQTVNLPALPSKVRILPLHHSGRRGRVAGRWRLVWLRKVVEKSKNVVRKARTTQVAVSFSDS